VQASRFAVRGLGLRSAILVEAVGGLGVGLIAAALDCSQGANVPPLTAQVTEPCWTLRRSRLRRFRSSR
jgi:hypothetical protein